jgi:hypothetical protein
MKKLLVLTCLFLTCYISTFAQVGVNTDNSSPDPSAGLDVKFNNKGFLPPRMTTTERNAIVAPAEGLQVFNTTSKCLQHFVNGIWQDIHCACTNPVVAPITGTATVNTGSTTQLACATSGGTWYTSNPALATVNSSTGLVTGVAAGTPTITYTVTSGSCSTSVTQIVTVNYVDPCALAGGMLYGGYCWLPTSTGPGQAEINCANHCTSLGKTCNSTVMQGISQSDATNIVHLFHPGVTMTSSGDAPAYQWGTGTGNYFVEGSTCTHNDNVAGRQRYCVCTPEP